LLTASFNREDLDNRVVKLPLASGKLFEIMEIYPLINDHLNTAGYLFERLRMQIKTLMLYDEHENIILTLENITADFFHPESHDIIITQENIDRQREKYAASTR
jgi:hypothetical protein